MSYTLETHRNSGNYASGRPYGIKGITIHHWGRDGQRFETVRDYLCRPGGDSSAHYVVQAGRVACIVDPDDRAYQAGDGLRGHSGNNTTVGIECRPEKSDADFETVAELIADLWDTYGVLPLSPHSRWTATACPGRWHGALAALRDRAHAIRAARGHSVGATAPKPPAASTVQLLVDGEFGQASIRLAQTVYGVPVDGIIGHQPIELRQHLPALDFPGGGLAFGDGQSATVRALQTTLARGGYRPGEIDGIFGPATITALQRALGVAADGYLGHQTAAAWQTYLNAESRKRGIKEA